MTDDRRAADAFWIRICVIIGLIVCGAVAFLILGPRPANTASLDVSGLPLVNASLNATTALLLVLGFLLIKARRIPLHKSVMLTSFGTSTAFLVSYVIYHWFKEGPKSYEGEHTGLYLFILLTHIVLAAGIVPMALVTLYLGWTDRRSRHRWLARITLPLWLYVSVTGVVIYLMLYPS